MNRRIFVLPIAVLLMGCASSQGDGPRRSARTLLADEIQEAASMTVYQAVERYRPQWLRSRGSPTMANPEPMEPAVYVDGVRMEGLRELTRMRADAVERMQYLTPSDATGRFGTNHQSGAILVITRTR